MKTPFAKAFGVSTNPGQSQSQSHRLAARGGRSTTHLSRCGVGQALTAAKCVMLAFCVAHAAYAQPSRQGTSFRAGATRLPTSPKEGRSRTTLV